VTDDSVVLLQRLGPRSWGRQPGTLRSLRHPELRRLTVRLRDLLVDRFGSPRLTAPHADRRWRGGLVESLVAAVVPDGGLPFALADFGPALLFAAPGRPVLWLWLSEAAESVWPELLSGLGPTASDPEDWSGRVPDRPVLRADGPRAALHWGEGASWRDGSRVLGFSAGLGARPPEVYLPPAATWPDRVPDWAVALRDQVCRDLAALGARVVEREDAVVQVSGSS
jgi:hypothetical protein